MILLNKDTKGGKCFLNKKADLFFFTKKGQTYTDNNLKF